MNDQTVYVEYRGKKIPRKRYLQLCLTKIKKRNAKQKENITERMQLESANASVQNITRTLKKPVKSAANGLPTGTKKNALPTKGSIMNATKPNLEEKSMQPVENATQPTVLKPTSELLRQEISQSMNLINASASALHSSMKSVLADLPNEEGSVPVHRLDRVKVAVSCAREIKELMKVKVDAARVLKDFGALKNERE